LVVIGGNKFVAAPKAISGNKNNSFFMLLVVTAGVATALLIENVIDV